MTDINLPPPCPVCAGQTTLKDMRKLPKAGSYMCFFHCLACATEYPRAVDGIDATLAGLISKVPLPPSRDGV